MNQMEQIRKELTRHIGKRVILKADKGRKKIVTRRGRLVEVYPSLFVVDMTTTKWKIKKFPRSKSSSLKGGTFFVS